eukprot:403846_1
MDFLFKFIVNLFFPSIPYFLTWYYFIIQSSLVHNFVKRDTVIILAYCCIWFNPIHYWYPINIIYSVTNTYIYLLQIHIFMYFVVLQIKDIAHYNITYKFCSNQTVIIHYILYPTLQPFILLCITIYFINGYLQLNYINLLHVALSPFASCSIF